MACSAAQYESFPAPFPVALQNFLCRVEASLQGHSHPDLSGPTYLTNNEEDDGHGSTGQGDKHEELEPENQPLLGERKSNLTFHQLSSIFISIYVSKKRILKESIKPNL